MGRRKMEEEEEEMKMSWDSIPQRMCWSSLDSTKWPRRRKDRCAYSPRAQSRAMGCTRACDGSLPQLSRAHAHNFFNGGSSNGSRNRCSAARANYHCEMAPHADYSSHGCHCEYEYVKNSVPV